MKNTKRKSVLLRERIFVLAAVKGFDRLLWLRLADLPLGDPNSSNFGTRLPLSAKNNSLNCF